MCLDEYAIRVYTLVDHALRAKAQDRLWSAQIARVAQAENNDFKQFISEMERYTHDILEEEITRPKD